jgi:ATP-dependent DNA helicase RecG
MCGLANTSTGGWVILGVADKTWQIVGLKTPAQACDTILYAARLCKPFVPLEPEQPEVVIVKGKKLAVARIPPNNGTLYQAGKVYWLRKGTQTSAMEMGELTRFIYNQGILSWELQPVLNATVEDLDEEIIEEYLAHLTRRHQRPGRITETTQLLMNLKCVTTITNSSNQTSIHPTNVGILLFGRSPRDFLSQAEVIATYYPDTTGVRRYSDRKIITGAIHRQIDEVGELLERWIPEAGYVKGFHRIDVPALPREALREAVVNAVVHRDYSVAGTAVRLFYYPDRVEIYSPGTLMPPVNLEELSHGLVGSWPRNPELSSILRDFPGGYMERIGSGINFIINETRNMGLPTPDFKEQAGEFIVTFYRMPTATEPYILQETKKPETSPASSKHPTQPDITPPDHVLTQQERQEAALKFVRQHGAISFAQYMLLTGATETTAIRDLKALTDRQALRKTGAGRSRRYLI